MCIIEKTDGESTTDLIRKAIAAIKVRPCREGEVYFVAYADEEAEETRYLKFVSVEGVWSYMEEDFRK